MQKNYVPRLVKILESVLICSAIVVYASALLLPIYTDEITSRSIYSRYLIDGHKLLYLFPQCVSTYVMESPLLFLPKFLLDGQIYGDLTWLSKIRIIGWLSCTMWIAFLCTCLHHFNKQLNRGHSLYSSSFVISIFCLGVTPFMMVLNRPEQLIAWIIVVLIFGSIFSNKLAKRNFTWSLILCLLSIFLFSSHPKSLFFLPLVLISIHYIVISKKLRVVVMMFALVCATQSYLFFTQRNQCPEDPELVERFQSEIITPRRLFTDPLNTSLLFFHNISNYREHFNNINFHSRYPFDWIPVELNNNEITKLQSLLNIINYIFLNIVLIIGIISTYNSIKNDAKRKYLSNETGVLIGLSVSLVSLLGFESTKLFYETRLFLPLMIVWAAVGVSTRPFRIHQSIKNAIIFLILTVGISNNFASIVTFQKPARLWITAELSKYPYMFSVPAFSYLKIKNNIFSIATECGIFPPEKQKRLILDDLTYPAFSKSYRPFHMLYIFSWSSIKNIPDFMHQRASDGIIVRCDWLTDKSEYPHLIQKDEICCWKPVKK